MKLCSPQLEKGHTRIANELLEAIIAYPFNASEFKVVFVIIRKTYGWKKKAAPISYGTIAKMARVNKRHIRRVINKLLAERVIIKDKSRNANVLGLNKYYLHWKLWITAKDKGAATPSVGADRPSGEGCQAPKSEGLQASTLNKERNIYKESIKERRNFSSSFLKHKTENFREHLREPIHIGELIQRVIPTKEVAR